jgi:quinoprotein dehydrogenase-associated probable ABC transporter substrate-binding protein
MERRKVFGVALACMLTQGAVWAEENLPKTLRVCADPGNMPLSNNRSEGLENKLAELLADSMHAGLVYHWRPSFERGLTRTTLDAEACDVMFDMPSGVERVLTTVPLYRSTFVLAYRKDRGFKFRGLDDPRLKQLRVGVYQMSAARQALAEHGLKNQTVLHFISHDGDLVPEHQPSYQVQQVINKELDVAAVWGPLAGYYRTVKKGPLVLQPVNLAENSVPLEFDMSVAVRRSDTRLKEQIENVLRKERGKVLKVLSHYGVPLVRCDTCIVAGDLPSHGPYVERKSERSTITRTAGADVDAKTQAEVDRALASGSDINTELNNAIVGRDLGRVKYLLDKGADVNGRDKLGYTPLTNATRLGDSAIAALLLERKADPRLADHDGWTPMLYAAWLDDAATVQLLARQGVDIEGANASGLSPLGVAAQYNKLKSVEALLGLGAQIDKKMGGAGYTPLMLAVAGGSNDVVKSLVKHGASVNVSNEGGVTPLMIAAARNQTQTAELLLQAGASTDARTSDGRDALTLARENSSDAVVKLLEERKKHS